MIITLFRFRVSDLYLPVDDSLDIKSLTYHLPDASLAGRGSVVAPNNPREKAKSTTELLVPGHVPP